LKTGFNPQLLIGATVFGNVGEIAAGVFFDLPSVSATLSYIENVNASCDDVGNSGQKPIPGGLTNIVPSVVFDAGLFAEAAIGNGEYSIGEVRTYQFTNYTLPLSTVCLRFDPTASTFAPATNPATATATGSHGAKPTSAAVVLVNPVTKMVSSMGRQAILVLSFILMSAFFASL
jgi:hypothetical protein